MKSLQFALCAAGLVLGSMVVAAPSPYESALDFKINAPSMEQALNEFAQQTGLQLVFPAEEVTQGLAARQVGGKLTPRAALELLLADSGLYYRFINANTVAIRAEKTLGRKSSGATAVGSNNHVLQMAWVDQGDAAISLTDASETGNSADRHRDPAVLEEIIVTAQRREQSLQDVPLSVTAIGTEELQRRGAIDIKDVINSVPGLAMTGVDRGSSEYIIRGVTKIGGNQATTGIFLDDLSLGSPATGFNGAIDPLLFDIARVEVLRGPQGTLYGGSAMGGAIKYVSNLPDTNNFVLNLASGAANTAHGAPSYNGEAVINLPLVAGTLAFRAGVRFVHEGGYIDNVAGLDIEDTSVSSTPYPVYTPLLKNSLSQVNQKDMNSSDTLTGRATLLWQPDPTLSIRPGVFYQTTTTANPSWYNSNLKPLTSTFRYVNQENSDRFVQPSPNIDKELGSVKLSSLSSYSKREQVWVRDYSYYVNGVLWFVPALEPYDSLANYPAETSVLTQELRVSSNSGPGDKWNWVVGAFYSRQKDSFDPSVFVYTAGANPSLAPFEGDILQGNRDYDTKNRAVFGDVTFSPADQLHISVGVRGFRITRHESDLDKGLVGDSNYIKDSEETSTSPKFSIAYSLNADHMLYASATKGFRSGGPTSNAFANASLDCSADLARLGFTTVPEEYTSDTLWSYELGSKNAFDSGRVMLNASGYRIDWKDIQQSLALASCGQRFTVNAGAARILGAELEARVRVAAGFEVGGNLSYSEGEITDPGVLITLTKGDPVQAIPDWVGTVYGTYERPLSGNWSWNARAEYQYRGKLFSSLVTDTTVRFQADNNAGFPVDYISPAQESYGLTNISVGFDNDKETIRLYINNVLDERPILDKDYSFHATKATTLRPRTFGAEFRRTF